MPSVASCWRVRDNDLSKGYPLQDNIPSSKAFPSSKICHTLVKIAIWQEKGSAAAGDVQALTYLAATFTRVHSIVRFHGRFWIPSSMLHGPMWLYPVQKAGRVFARTRSRDGKAERRQGRVSIGCASLPASY